MRYLAAGSLFAILIPKRESVALQTFFEVHVPTLRPKIQYQIKRVLNRHFAKPFKYKRLDEIEYHDVTGITDKLAKTAPNEAWRSGTKWSNCRVGYPVDEVHAYIAALRNSRPPQMRERPTLLAEV
jgi:hypothetical protein